MIDDIFIKKELENDPSFTILFDHLQNQNKENGKKFLILLNSILNYYLNLNQTNLLIPIIHFPHTEKWAKELAIHFLILKNSFLFEDFNFKKGNWQQILNTPIIARDKNSIKQQRESRNYIRLAKKFIEVAEKHRETHGFTNKCNLLCARNIIINNLPEFYKLFYNTNFLNTDLAMNTNIKRDSIAKDHQNFIKNIENIFLINSGTDPGSIIRSFQANDLNLLNRFGCNIQRMIVFSFDDSPCRLYKLQNNFKIGLNSKYNNNQLNNSFVSFSKEEISFLFDRKENVESWLLGNDEKVFFDSFCYVFDSELIKPRMRNLYALCANNDIKKEIINKIKEITGEFDDAMDIQCENLFNSIKNKWEYEVISKIVEFCELKPIALIVSWDTTDKIKQYLKAFLKNKNIKVNFYLISDLKKSNLIKEEKIVIINYKSPNSYWHPYPNTLDEVLLAENQVVLQIINLSLFNYINLNDQYQYKKELNETLKSDYRISKLIWHQFHEIKPIIISEREIDFRDDEYENETNNVNNLLVTYADKSTKSVFPSDLCLIKQQNNLKIETIKQIKNQIDLIDGFQLLLEFYETIKNFIYSVSKEDQQIELNIRRNDKYKLSEFEINSTFEMWKILLKRKVDKVGVSQAYKDLNPSISINTFQNSWIVLDSEMILPRDLNDIKSLLKYLLLWEDKSYFKILYRKKLIAKSNTRKVNNLIENLLIDILLISQITEDQYSELKEKHKDILELLSINEIESLQILLDLLKDKINFKKITSIY